MTDDQRAFGAAAGMGLCIVVIAFTLAALFKTPFGPQFTTTPSAIIWGVVGAAPLAALLLLFMRTDIAPIAAFREDQIDFLGTLGFRLTAPRIVAISLIACVGEELLFRGVFQTALATHVPLIAAILVPNIFFGLLHARTLIYAIIAGSAGAYFGWLFAVTGTLVVPIIAHALYDCVALAVARIALNQRDEAASSNS
ncbi:MAG: CPBP family intramembrane glutamic endopeptidase [Pseudomonadota bacterium]